MHIGPELVGCVASGLVLLTFTTRSMRPLRILAILSNLAFIGYGTLDHIVPVLALHLILLPLNVFRLWQLKPEPGRAQDGFTPAWRGQPLLRISGPGVTVHDIEPLESGRWAVTLDIEGGNIGELLKLSIEVGGISALGGISGAEAGAPVPPQEPPRGVSPAAAPALP